MLMGSTLTRNATSLHAAGTNTTQPQWRHSSIRFAGA